MRSVPVVLAVLALVGCGRKSSESGLPPASDWNSKAAVDVALPEPDRAHGATADEQGDEGQEAPPGPASGPMPNDSVHRGLGGNGGGAADNNGSPSDMSALGLPAPDPNRPIDPTHRIAGVIGVDPKVAERVGAQKPLFLAVKRVGADGNPTGSAIAVQKLVWTKAGLAFELTDRDAMLGTGDTLTGDVVVIAHYDLDGDALSKTSGDVIGQTKVKVPAEGVTVTLDTVVP